jgi:hypothetical protein
LSKSDPKATRLDLARWAVSPENPLAARVIVNRLWQAYFGRGLVETSEDFGTQSPKPEYAELLDWLAGELMDNDWNLKHIHRLILSSAAFRQSSGERPDLRESDPQNRLFARQDRLRLEAEIIRDVSLAAGGLLSDKIGGPSVFPYQPAGVMAGRADSTEWRESEGEDKYRRGMYTHYWRLTPHPFLTLFDAPDASESCARRSRSNTPVQALMLLNDPSQIEAAAALAGRVVRESSAKTDKERLAWAFKECLGRDPSSEEAAVLAEVLANQQASYEHDQARAKELIAKNSAGGDAARQAAWTAVARTLLNLDEFITRE